MLPTPHPKSQLESTQHHPITACDIVRTSILLIAE